MAEMILEDGDVQESMEQMALEINDILSDS